MDWSAEAMSGYASDSPLWGMTNSKSFELRLLAHVYARAGVGRRKNNC